MKRVKVALRWIYGIALFVAGANHFAMTDFYLGIMPPYLPWPLALVYVSGACEMALGIALLSRDLARMAACGMIALIIAVTPANLHMAVHPELFPQFSPGGLWVRLALQIVLLAWAYWYTLPDEHAEQTRRQA